MAQGPWTDLYALGATVHYMLTGEVPTPAVMRVVSDARTPLAAAGRSTFPGVGTRFLAAIDWTAAVAPKDRPQSVAALREALGYDEPPVPSSTATPPAKRPGRRALVALALAVSGVLGVGAWTLVATSSKLAASAPPQASVPMPTPAPAIVPAPRAAVAPAQEAVAATQSPTPMTAEPPPAMTVAPALDAAPAPVQRPAPPKRRPAAAKSLAPAAPTSPASEAAAVGMRSPAEACAGRNFIARAICISRQCQAAGSRMHPECAEARRIEEQRQRRTDR
jgi:hypothetical protein